MTRLAPALLSVAAGSLARTWRWDIRGAEHVMDVRGAGERVLFAPWHATMLPLIWKHRHEGITLLVSGHADGGLLAGVAARWGYRIVRGSSTRGGARGYRMLLRGLAAGRDAGLTPDGPRGPAEHVKPGVIALARNAPAAIVPVGVRASGAWRLRSWDRFLVPQPGAHVRVVYGPPLRVAPGTPADDARIDLERRLRAVNEAAA